MPHAIRIHAYGGPEQLRWEEIEVGEPGSGQVRLKQTAVGLNYIDTYHRTGLYPLPALPGVLGMEAAGIVDAVGPGVTEFVPGSRAAYASPPPGAYAEVRLVAADRLVPVPDDVSDEQAAAVLLQGMTAWYLLRRTYPVKAGDTILIHAAAGGVGLMVCQWAKALGATVIGTVSSDDKAALAHANGCDHPIVYTREDVVARVRALTHGEGVPVVYDSVGKDTFAASLDCLRPLGLMVSFGNASGAVPPFEPAILAQKGSLFLTRPTLFHYTSNRRELLAAASELFAVLRSGAVRIHLNQRYPLKDAAVAHRDIEARRTTGSTVLIP
jgi:NADPH2:quinone reductase